MPRSPKRRLYTAAKIRAMKNRSPATTLVFSSAPSDIAASATGRPNARVRACSCRCFSLMAKVATMAPMAPVTM